MKDELFEEDWKIVTSFLPEGWEEQASLLGALTRRRKVKSANVLLRILLMYLASDQ